MKDVLIVEYEDERENVFFVSEKRLFEILQEEGLKDVKIRRQFAAYKLGDCIIDWSFNSKI